MLLFLCRPHHPLWRLWLFVLWIVVGVLIVTAAAAVDAEKTRTTTPLSLRVATPMKTKKSSSSSSSVLPVWNWEIFPAFFHGSNVDNFTDEDLQFITKFPIVTLEKWQGPQKREHQQSQSQSTSWYCDGDDRSSRNPSKKVAGTEESSTNCNCGTEEEAWIHAATKMKVANPNITIIVWLDSLRIYTANRNLNPDLKQPCTTGNFGPAEFLESGGRMDGKLNVRSEYLVKNQSGLPALETWSHCHIYDFTSSKVRDYWKDMCLNLTTTHVIDGCGADASWQTGVEQNWGLSPVKAQAWKEGHQQMMRETTQALEKNGGILLGKYDYEVGDYVNGALCEHCPPNNDTINLLRNLTSKSKSMNKRLIYECRGSGDVHEIAAFLIGVGPYQYYGMGGWNDGISMAADKHWLDGVFDQKLGEPNSDGIFDFTTKKWKRSFYSGTTVEFDTITNQGQIVWG